MQDDHQQEEHQHEEHYASKNLEPADSKQPTEQPTYDSFAGEPFHPELDNTAPLTNATGEAKPPDNTQTSAHGDTHLHKGLESQAEDEEG